MLDSRRIAEEKAKRVAREDELGADIIDECRVQLMLKFRFLDLALWKMELAPARVGSRYPLATDARRVIYDPPRVVARFQESFEESVRDYLHLIMHCIFRHPFDKHRDCREAWELTCDIVVENAVIELCGGRFASELDDARREAVSEIRMLAGKIVPGTVYALLRNVVKTPDGQSYRGLGKSVLTDWRALFERDDHGAWPAFAKGGDAGEQSDPAKDDDADEAAAEDAIRTDSPDDQTQEQPAGGEDVEAAEDERPADEGARESAEDADDAESRPDERPQDAADQERREREWEDVSKQIEMNLETFSREWGDEAGSLVANLAFANRKIHGYTDFLKRFMTSSEEMRLNMDEFDCIYYTYGMDLYGNMPLIEPLEYKETERVREFAVVIDTSESVSGDLVRRFLRHTFSILKSSEDFTRDVNIHLIQCDAKVQADTKIRNLRDVDKMMEGFVVRGFGGTDFRPAFDYVEQLRRRGEFKNLKGLIYFTDGFGRFPEKTPDFDAAFVFMDDGDQIPAVPPWAMKAVIDEEQLDSFG